MIDKKKRLFSLLEFYINDFQKESIEKIYGVGTKIKVHSMGESYSTNSLSFELVIVLGDTINEECLVGELADVLINDALVYFFPHHRISTLIRWDV